MELTEIERDQTPLILMTSKRHICTRTFELLLPFKPLFLKISKYFQNMGYNFYNETEDSNEPCPLYSIPTQCEFRPLWQLSGKMARCCQSFASPCPLNTWPTTRDQNSHLRRSSLDHTNQCSIGPQQGQFMLCRRSR